MNPKMIAKQVIDFNKATFDNTFDTITVLQNHSEKMVGLFLEKATLFPPEGKKVMAEWMESYKKGRIDFKTSVDDRFKTVEDFFVGAANVTGFSIYGLMEKTGPSWREVTDEVKKIPVETVNKSIPTVATAAVKKETAVKGKSGAGIAKSVRRTVKTVKK